MKEATKTTFTLDASQGRIYTLEPKHSAFSARIKMPDVPALYRRTYMLGIAFGPLIAGIAGLFDYDADVWLWSKSEGFKAVKLTKREKL